MTKDISLFAYPSGIFSFVGNIGFLPPTLRYLTWATSQEAFAFARKHGFEDRIR